MAPIAPVRGRSGMEHHVMIDIYMYAHSRFIWGLDLCKQAFYPVTTRHIHVPVFIRGVNHVHAQVHVHTVYTCMFCTDAQPLSS